MRKIALLFIPVVGVLLLGGFIDTIKTRLFSTNFKITVKVPGYVRPLFLC